MPNLLLVLIAMALLAGCERREEFSERRVNVQVVEVHLSSKSNSSVTLREVGGSHQVWTRQRLSCYRSKAEQVKVGSVWSVGEMTYVYPESQRFVTQLMGVPDICLLSNRP